ncbi:MAG: metallophosphoesterase family protein [Turicibacter sp.]|nr:metallophosphoesterase family protein [Turicibacter sp.]
MKIGVISDTHNVLREEVVDYLADCDAIIHAGDVCKEEIIIQLNEIAKTFVVRGNNDNFEGLADHLELELGGINIYVVHDKKDIPKPLDNFNLVIYGHSHKYEEEIKDGITYLNPGGCGRRRFSLPLTMAILIIEDNQLMINKLDISF